jgi:hypothetical protein
MLKRPRAPKTPSEAQAKKLAWLFQGDRYLTEASQTDAVLVKESWVTAKGGGYFINDAGLLALERYLCARRVAITAWGAMPSTTAARCTCAAIVNPNIPHSRTCPMSSTNQGGGK